MAERPALYWAELTAAGRRRRALRAALLIEAAGLGSVPTPRVLEVGCGIGDYTRAAAPHADARWIAVDVAPALLRHVRADAPSHVAAAAADVEILPFGADTFDTVLGNAVLHHLRLDRAVPELLRVLRPGGVFCFAEPNMLNPQVFLERNVPWLGRLFDNSPGETAFVRWTLRRRLAALGLTDVTVRPFDFLYPLVPRPLIAAAERVGRLLERTPVVAEIAGSLIVTARKPGVRGPRSSRATQEAPRP